jgi:hypothetical protein
MIERRHRPAAVNPNSGDYKAEETADGTKFYRFEAFLNDWIQVAGQDALYCYVPRDYYERLKAKRKG